MSRKEIGLQRNTQLCVNYILKEKYLLRREKYTLQRSMNPVPTVYPQKLLSKHLVTNTANYSQSSQKKIFPNELSAFQQHYIM